MKRIAVIAAVLLAAFAIGAYFLLSGEPEKRSVDPKDLTQAAGPASLKERALSGEHTGKDSSLAADEDNDPAVRAALARIAAERSSRRVTGIRTEVWLSGGEIGFVDVESILRDQDPHSVIALLQEHQVLTGAGEALELEIDRAWQEEWGGYNARYSQVIGGVPTPGRGSVLFEASGAVLSVNAILIDPSTARPNSVNILQAEAAALTRPVAVRLVEPERPRFVEAGRSLIVEVDSPELRYILNPDNATELRAAWRVLVGTYNPPDEIEVLIDAETGEVIGAKSVIQTAPAKTACTAVEFRVCDGTIATSASCNRTVMNPVELIYDGTQGCAADKKTCGKRDTRHPGILPMTPETMWAV